jgi:hypothetical protein
VGSSQSSDYLPTAGFTTIHNANNYYEDAAHLPDLGHPDEFEGHAPAFLVEDNPPM